MNFDASIIEQFLKSVNTSSFVNKLFSLTFKCCRHFAFLSFFMRLYLFIFSVLSNERKTAYVVTIFREGLTLISIYRPISIAFTVIKIIVDYMKTFITNHNILICYPNLFRAFDKQGLPYWYKRSSVILNFFLSF